MIDEVNEMFIGLARRKEFPQLYHIDCREVAQNKDDWFDELHLKSDAFKIVASAYSGFINGTILAADKVIVAQKPSSYREFVSTGKRSYETITA
jgi:hypothetical protein